MIMIEEFSIAAASGLDETQSFGNVHRVSGTRFTNLDFLTEGLDSGYLACNYASSIFFCIHCPTKGKRQ